MTAPAACTIVSNNYLAYARVLAESFRRLHPEGRFYVLVVDRPAAEIDYGAEPFEVLFARDLAIPAFDNLAFRYSILELNTAVKPYFLAWLRRTAGAERACYFDPDIRVLGDLGELYARLATADLVLTPHITEPLRDDKHPGDREFLRSGTYNLGFLGISFNSATAGFLEWWQEKLHRECLHRVEEGLFVDQRWMDLAPSFLERVAILRDPGYNVAYWNLSHRRLARDDDGDWRVDGRPLRFFHFSGFDPDDPDRLSRFQDRYRLADRPDVAPLFDAYRGALLEAGWEELRDLPYGYGRFGNGVEVPPLARELLREVDPDGARWPDPFDVGAGGSFCHWLTDGAGPGEEARLPRIALALWERRRDLQRAFPDPGGADGAAFARWLVDGGHRKAGLAPELVEPVRRAVAEASRGEGPTGGPAGGGAGAVSLDGPLAERWSTPLDRDQIAWLVADAGREPDRRPRIPRLAMKIHARRPDLTRAFPEPLGASRRALARWYVTYGRREYSLPPELVRPVLATLPLADRLRALIWDALGRLRGTGR